MSNEGTISPEALEAMLQIGNMGNEQSAIQRQLAQIDALRAPMEPHHSALGGGLGAAAHILDSYQANKKEQAAQGRMTDMGGRLTAAQRAMIEALRGSPAPTQGAAPEDLVPPQPTS